MKPGTDKWDADQAKIDAANVLHDQRRLAAELEQTARALPLVTLDPEAKHESAVRPPAPERAHPYRRGMAEDAPLQPEPRPSYTVNPALGTPEQQEIWARHQPRISDPEPEKDTPAWDAWWLRERRRRHGDLSTVPVSVQIERQALARIDELREEDLRALTDTPAKRRRRSRRYWRPRGLHVRV